MTEPEKDLGGRPLKFETVDVLEKKIEEWLAQRKSENMPLTMTSLANYLDCDYQTLINYNERPGFSSLIKRANQLCEDYAESFLFNGKNPAGAIFNLTNNYKGRWQNKQFRDEKHEHSGNVTVVTKVPESST